MMDEVINLLVHHGVLEIGPVCAWSPLFFVHKDGSEDLRLVYDARNINLGITDNECDLPDLFDPCS